MKTEKETLKDTGQSFEMNIKKACERYDNAISDAKAHISETQKIIDSNNEQIAELKKGVRRAEKMSYVFGLIGIVCFVCIVARVIIKLSQ